MPFSGSSVNPARTFGPALIGNEWTGIWIYFVAPPLGAVLAWLVHKIVVEGDTNFAMTFRRYARTGSASREQEPRRGDAATD